MRLLVVVTGLLIGLSGCVGGSIVHRMPAGNETADAPGGAEGSDAAGSDGEAPAWVLDQKGEPGKGSDSASFKEAGSGKGAPKDPGEGDQKEDPGDGSPGENQTWGGGGGGEQDPLQDLKDEAPTEGAAGAEEIGAGLEDEVNDQSEVLLPKEPLEDPDAGDVEGTNVGVPTSGAKVIPSTSTDLV